MPFLLYVFLMEIQGTRGVGFIMKFLILGVEDRSFESYKGLVKNIKIPVGSHQKLLELKEGDTKQ